MIIPYNIILVINLPLHFHSFASSFSFCPSSLLLGLSFSCLSFSFYHLLGSNLHPPAILLIGYALNSIYNNTNSCKSNVYKYTLYKHNTQNINEHYYKQLPLVELRHSLQNSHFDPHLLRRPRHLQVHNKLVKPVLHTTHLPTT